MNKALSFREMGEAPAELWQQPLDLLHRHNIYFETRLAEDPSLRETAHKIRYQVYCLERGFENAGEHSGGLEKDAYDERSLQGILIHRPTGEAMGTVRMVLPDSAVLGGLPVGQLLAQNGIDLADYVPMAETIEVSRFAISKNLRRRATDDKEFGGSGEGHHSERIRQGNLPCLSLIQFLVRQSMHDGVRFWVAAMELKLLRMLHGMGIHFTAIGPQVMHHGLRQPCYCNVAKMLDDVRREQPEYWKVITDGGALTAR